MPHPPQLALHRPAHNLNSLPETQLPRLEGLMALWTPCLFLWSMSISSIESSSTPGECPVFQNSTGSMSASIFGVSPHGITLNWPLCRRSIFGTVDPHTSPLRPTFTRWICQLLGKILFSTDNNQAADQRQLTEGLVGCNKTDTGTGGSNLQV